jgi:ABC-type polysaccharide/polyol phosphate export permease
MIFKLKDLWVHRELLYNMTVKELKVKYKRSVLGFVWSFVTPMIMLAVFSLVFAILAKGGNMQWFAVYLMCGLLPWLFFVNSLMQSVGSVVANPALIKRVYFPREILPLAAVGANIFHFIMQMLVFFIFLLIIQWHFSIYLLLFPLVLLLEVVFALGMALFISAANVYLRDVQHFVEVATMAWFWLTPIVYTMATLTKVAGKYTWIYLLNPMANIVLLWQYIIYNPYYCGPSAAYVPVWGIVYTSVLSVMLLFASYYYFTRSERGFAELI